MRIGSLCTMLVSAGMAALAGCGDGIGPTGGVLKGKWGSASAQLVATDSGATLLQVCSLTRTNTPLVLDSDGSFSALGERLRVGGPPPQEFERPGAVTVSGQTAGPGEIFLRLVIRSVGAEGDGETVLLKRGVTVDIPNCP